MKSQVHSHQISRKSHCLLLDIKNNYFCLILKYFLLLVIKKMFKIFSIISLFDFSFFLVEKPIFSHQISRKTPLPTFRPRNNIFYLIFIDYQSLGHKFIVRNFLNKKCHTLVPKSLKCNSSAQKLECFFKIKTNTHLIC